MHPQHRPKLSDLALDHAPPVLEFAKAALELAPIPGLSLIVEALSVIVERVKDARTNNETEAALFAKIKALDTAITEMVNKAKAAAGGHGLTDLQARLEQLSSALVGLQKCAGDIKGGRGFRGSAKSFFYSKRNEAILEDISNGMDNALAMFHLRAQVATELAVDDVKQAVDGVGHTANHIESIVMNADERSIVESIPHCASAGYRCVDELKSGFTSGTRAELFEELRKWCEFGFPDDVPKGLYLLSGSAGLGKSAIAHQLCTRIAETWRLNLGSSFFFLRGSGDRESARTFFSTVAYQLALSQPLLRPHIVQAAQEYLRNGVDQQMQSSFRQLLLKPLTDAPGLLRNQAPTLIVVDGLDECKDRELVPDLLRCLLELVRRVPWLRVLLASRPELHILPVLTSDKASSSVHHRSLNDTVKDWQDDVALYLRETVPKIGRYSDYVRDHPGALNDLISRAEGVFVYARVAVKFLELYDDHPEEQFRYLLQSTGTGLTSLDNLYLLVLKLAFPPDGMEYGSPRHLRLMKVLSFLALRHGNLPAGSIALLLGLPEEDVLWIVDRMRSVVLIDADGDVVPLHATFGEFLLDPKRCILPLYHIDTAVGHARLASGCMSAFSFDTATAFLIVKQQNQSTSYTLRYVQYSFQWTDHLEKAVFDEALRQQAYSLIWLQLPIVVRLSGKTIAAESDRLRAFFGSWEDSTRLRKGYLEVGNALIEWWQDMAKQSKGAILEIPALKNREQLRRAGLDSPLDAADVAHYQEVVEDLARRIKQENMEKLWYDFGSHSPYGF